MIAESFERIHRSNLVGMGVLPLQFADGDSAESLGLTGEEEFSITGIEGGEAKEVTVRADDKEFTARVRIDTPKEVEYFQHGGILRSCCESPGELSCRGFMPLPDDLRKLLTAAGPSGYEQAPAAVFREAAARLRRGHARHRRLDRRARARHRRRAARSRSSATSTRSA